MNKLTPKVLAQLLLELTEEKSEAEIQKVLKEFVPFVARKRMLGKMNEIIVEYRKLYNKKHSITEATVTLISRLEENVRLKLRETLKKKYNAKEVHMLEKVDARLIGGMKVRVDDMVYDMSIKKVLTQLENALTA